MSTYFYISIFFCSFFVCLQVHEKTILVVALPVLLCFSLDPLICLWFLQIATFSMTPLLIKDGLLFSYILTNVLYLLIIRLVTGLKETNKKRDSIPFDVLNLSTLSTSNIFIYGFYLSAVIGCSALVFGLGFVTPPAKLPHLFPLLISVYSCLHFLAFLAYFNIRQFIGYYDDEEEGVFVIKLNKKAKKAKEVKTD